MTPTEIAPAPVEVTQADRDRAEAFWQECGPFRMGTVSALSAAFARHRIAHSAPAGEVEPVAWMYAHPDGRSAVVTGRLEKLYERFGRDESWTETPLYTHPAPPADLVELVEALRWFADGDIDVSGTALIYAEPLQPRLAAARAALAKHGGA